MNNNIMTNPSKILANLFIRYSIIGFIVITVATLIFAVITINNIIPSQALINDLSKSGITIDSQTMDKINALQPGVDLPLPLGRTNPLN